MGLPEYLLYASIKWMAYACWCFVGLRWFQPPRTDAVRAAALWGFGRLLLGLGLGLVIFIAALSMNNATRNAPMTYLAIYVPVRVGEWLLWYSLLRRPTADGKPRPASTIALWVAGGVVISCLADVPLGIMEGGVVPVGRPFC